MKQSDRNELMLKLMNLLKTHDWDYEYSDDHRVWSNGSDQSQTIVNIVNLLKLSKEDIKDLSLQNERILKYSHRYECFKNPIFTNA